MTNALSSILLFINILAVGWVLLLTFGPAHIPVVHDVQTERTSYVRGDELMYTVHFTKFVERPVTTTRNILCDDGNLITLAPLVDNAPLGENKSIQSVTLPMKASVSTCRLDFKATYNINFLRTETLSFTSNDFVITN